MDECSAVHVPLPGFAAWVADRARGSDRFLLGIVGPPGCGKSTLSEQLASELGASIAPMDGFHLANVELDRRGLRGVKGAPETFAVHDFVTAVGELRRGDRDVSWPAFDRVVDEPLPGRILVRRSEPVVVVEGNYLLLDTDPWRQLRDLLDVVAYLDIDRSLRVRRLIDRHVEFGRSVVEAAKFVAASDERNAELVEATRHHADVIVS